MKDRETHSKIRKELLLLLQPQSVIKRLHAGHSRKKKKKKKKKKKRRAPHLQLQPPAVQWRTRQWRPQRHQDAR